jgi:hypothetical protein
MFNLCIHGVEKLVIEKNNEYGWLNLSVHDDKLSHNELTLFKSHNNDFSDIKIINNVPPSIHYFERFNQIRELLSNLKEEIECMNDNLTSGHRYSFEYELRASM